VHQLDIFDYYSRSDVQQAIAAAARWREVAGSTREGTYLKRPDIIQYPRDVLEKVKRGAVAFHLSVERWSNPLAITTGANLQELRRGWDLLIDIDSKSKLEHARTAAAVVADFLMDHGVTPTVKFSGRRGFHIGVAWEAFPDTSDFLPTAQRYPEAPQALVGYIRENVKDKILEALVTEEGGVSALMGTVIGAKDLSPWHFVDLEQNWGARHLFRAPYSLHSGTWLVSTPVKLFKLKAFSTESARPENVQAALPFLENKPEEASNFFVSAMDWWAKHRQEEKPKVQKHGSGRKVRIPEEHFPPCVRLIMGGLQDGKKRSLFTLVNFLRAAGWNDEEIEQKVNEVNARHAQPLPTRMLSTHLKYHGRKITKVPPANCSNTDYYDAISICKPDALCANKAIKNPVNYAVKSYMRAARQTKAIKQSDKSAKRTIKRSRAAHGK
jgi:hypothetical protein